jgi:hypothetical protein
LVPTAVVLQVWNSNAGGCDNWLSQTSIARPVRTDGKPLDVAGWSILIMVLGKH